tara:strand:+ start:7943 stop:9172 length:1230 start_codon:yes stop_codon:yes gene_type:complete
MEFLPYIYLGYMFISLYFLSLYFLIYFRNKHDFFKYPKDRKNPLVSFIIPAYNEAESIEECLKHVFKSYNNILEVIVVNDCSTDNTKEIVNELKKKYSKIKLINNQKNLGNAAKSQNVGLKYAKADFVAIVDADSFPAENAINKMIGFLEDEKVGAVTCPIIARNRTKFIEKLQAIEYTAIAVTRKLLGYVEAIYVTPGPLALYRKKALQEIGGFDEENLTQDIEATWALTAHGWDRKMSLQASVSSTVPNKFKDWYKQRRRWNIGGLQSIWKYRKFLFKKNMLGLFIIPFFILSTFLGLLGLSIFFYLVTKRLISNFLLTRYSIVVGTPILTLDTLNVTPSVLNYLGIVLFIFGAIFTLLVLSLLKADVLKRQNILNILFYLVVYIAVYPFIMLGAMWNALRGKRVWR